MQLKTQSVVLRSTLYRIPLSVENANGVPNAGGLLQLAKELGIHHTVDISQTQLAESIYLSIMRRYE